MEPGKGGNVLQLFGDLPSQWDAWDIGYTGDEWGVEPPADVSVVASGPLRASVRAVRRIGRSTLTQEYVLTAGSPLLEVGTHARWDEDHKLLKAAFHLSADADAATFEIPYGTIDRPTRPRTEAERAKWEVPGQRWADVSDRSGEHGLTLLNDSKYGYDVQGSVLRLSLLRAPKYPDPNADIGEHSFRYALYPHRAGWREADSYRRGAEFNVPLIPVMIQETRDGSLPPEGRLLSTDADHVVLSAFKPARDRKARPRFVVRISEVEGREGLITIHFPFQIAKAWTANLMEDIDAPLAADGETVSFPIGPYQLRTVLTEPAPGPPGLPGPR